MQVPRTPQLVDVAITARCNLRCRYCYHFTGPGDVPEDLPTGAWLEFFDQLGRLAVLRVGLEGGEPFLRRDLPELIEGIVKNRMRFHILTNGTLIRDDLAAFIAATRRCDYVQVSLDGPAPDIHEACRGKGSFAPALAGLVTLQRHGVPVTVRVTLTPHNIEALPALARFLLEELGLAAFSTNAAGFLGQCRTAGDGVKLSVADRTRAMALLWELEQQYPGRLLAAAGPLANVRTWSQIMQPGCTNNGHRPEGGYLVGCNCVFGKLAVRADGALIPCTMLAHLELGHISRDDLKDIWLHHPVLQELRERRRISLHDFEFCRDCAFLDHCTGSCPGVTYNYLGTLNHPNPDDCLQRFLAAGGRLPHVQP